MIPFVDHDSPDEIPSQALRPAPASRSASFSAGTSPENNVAVSNILRNFAVKTTKHPALKFYKLLKLITGNTPGPLKLIGMAAMMRLNRRMIGIFMDPVMACNLRCRMCYFSDPERRKEMHGVMSESQLADIEKSLYRNTLKLQIGCGAEPTLSPMLKRIVAGAKAYGVPNISLVTNGQLLAGDKIDLAELAETGLNELILSLHGTHKETYEFLMTNAHWENFQALVKKIAEVKKRFPKFSLRINYTVNSLNVDDLEGDKFWSIWGDAQPDTIQLRPVQNVGDTAWNDFDLTPLKEKYDSTIGAIIAESRRRGITIIAPGPEHLDAVDNIQDAYSAVVEDTSYCYVSPSSCYKPDFDPKADTFADYHRRHHTVRHLLKSAFTAHSRSRHATKKLNYKVK